MHSFRRFRQLPIILALLLLVLGVAPRSAQAALPVDLVTAAVGSHDVTSCAKSGSDEVPTNTPVAIINGINIWAALID